MAQTERIQLQALLKNTDNPDSLPEVRTNPVVQQLSQKLAEDRAALSQALVVYGANHPTAKKLQSQVDELQTQLDLQKKAIVSSMRASYAAAQTREGMMSAEMKGTSKELDKVARYTTLKKEVEANVALYNSLYARIKEAGISAASKSVDIQVVDPARVPDEPIRPRRLVNLAVGLLAALVGGIGLAFIREEFDNKLRSPEDIRRWIGSANVSIIPVISESENHSVKMGWSNKVVGALPAHAGDSKTDMFFLERPNSPEGEAVQALYASIMLSWPNNPPQTLLIVSAFPGEGKTTVALNLSYALAQHANTCLVDADLRRGRVANAFSLPAGQGLGDVLSGDADPRELFTRGSGNEQFVHPACRTLQGQFRPACMLGKNGAYSCRSAGTLPLRGYRLGSHSSLCGRTGAVNPGRRSDPGGTFRNYHSPSDAS